MTVLRDARARVRLTAEVGFGPAEIAMPTANAAIRHAIAALDSGDYAVVEVWVDGHDGTIRSDEIIELNTRWIDADAHLADLLSAALTDTTVAFNTQNIRAALESKGVSTEDAGSTIRFLSDAGVLDWIGPSSATFGLRSGHGQAWLGDRVNR